MSKKLHQKQPSISSSPSRAEKFQPTTPALTRLLRTNVASRSRSRSRSLSSPMFVRRKKTDIETQEPTSPKVTCIGQVRVKRSSKKSALSKPKPKTKPKPSHLCHWLRNALCCNGFNTRAEPPASSSSSSIRIRWFACYCKSVVSHDESIRRDVKPRDQVQDPDQDQEKEEDQERGVKLVEDAHVEETEVSTDFVASSPPKNALLLMRCRSEPRRSAERLSVSLPPHNKADEQNIDIDQNSDINNNSTSIINNSNSDNSVIIISSSCSSSSDKGVAHLGVTTGPLILTRCKSEPASRAAIKMNYSEHVPEFLSLGKKRRLDFYD